MIDQLLQYDKELFLFLNSLGSETWDNLWLGITNKWIFGTIYAVVLIYLMYKNFGLKAMLSLIVVAALMITFTDQITNLFKHGFMRPRPCGTTDIMDYIRYVATRCGRYSFFSGHASNSMAIAVFGGLLLRPYYKNLIFIFLFCSFIIAYSRIYLGVHFPLDVFCGMVFGALSGFAFYKLAKYVLKRFATKN